MLGMRCKEVSFPSWRGRPALESAAALVRATGELSALCHVDVPSGQQEACCSKRRVLHGAAGGVEAIYRGAREPKMAALV
jgi:hypothetical protein